MAPRKRRFSRRQRQQATPSIAPPSVIADSSSIVVAAGTIAVPVFTAVNWSTLPLGTGVSVPVRISSLRVEALANTTAPGILTVSLHDSSSSARITSKELMVGNSTRTRFTLKMPKSTDFGNLVVANPMITFGNLGGAMTVSYVIIVAARTL